MVRSMMKTKQENNVIDRVIEVYVEIKIELLWPIEYDAVYHEK